MVPNPLAGTVIKVFKGYYRLGRDAEGFGGLPEGQMATLAQALEVRFEFVVATDPQHTVRIECKVMAAAMSALVEDVGDLGIDVFFEQRVDLGNDRFGGTVFEVGGEFGAMVSGRVAPARSRTPSVRVVLSLLEMVTSSISRRTMRLRSRSGVSGSFHRRGKSVARSRIFWRCSSLSSLLTVIE